MGTSKLVDKAEKKVFLKKHQDRFEERLSIQNGRVVMGRGKEIARFTE